VTTFGQTHEIMIFSAEFAKANCGRPRCQPFSGELQRTDFGHL